jgi:ribosome assembly protein YihI (activator of Der GTPase)
MNRNGITGLEPPDVSAVNVLSKEVVGSSSTMKRIDFPTVGTTSSQNQSYSSGRMNLNLPSLEDNSEEKHVGAASGSKFFAANEETWRSNSYSHKKDGKIFLI